MPNPFFKHVIQTVMYVTQNLLRFTKFDVIGWHIDDKKGFVLYCVLDQDLGKCQYLLSHSIAV